MDGVEEEHAGWVADPGVVPVSLSADVHSFDEIGLKWVKKVRRTVGIRAMDELPRHRSSSPRIVLSWRKSRCPAETEDPSAHAPSTCLEVLSIAAREKLEMIGT